jgi:hypothetical protein
MERAEKKSAPRDRAATRHPSTKVALADVLRSLQDLVSNELSDEALGAVPAAAATPAPASEPAAPPPALEPVLAGHDTLVMPEPAPAVTEASAAGHTTIDFTAPVPVSKPEPNLIVAEEPPVADDLPSLTAIDEPPPTVVVATDEPDITLDTLTLDAPLPPAPEIDLNMPENVALNIPDPVSTAALASALSDPAMLTLDDKPATPGGEQQQLPHLTLDLSKPLPAETPGFADEAKPVRKPEKKAEKKPAAPDPNQHEISIEWDDIPVLNEAVELPAAAKPAPALAVPAAPPPVEIPASAARKLAIQVAARLNVEMRRSGKRGLSSDVITRLARILEEALAQAASNSENKPS